MSKASFASLIISKLKGAIGISGKDYSTDSASLAMSAIAAGITEYLIANTTITISYAGTIPGPPPTPDPVVTDTFKIVGSCAPPSASGSFTSWLTEIETNIIAGFNLAPKGNVGIIFPATPFMNIGINAIQSDVKNITSNSSSDPQQKAWEYICGKIIEWINSIAINTIPGAASNPLSTSTGMATITKITLT